MTEPLMIHPLLQKWIDVGTAAQEQVARLEAKLVGANAEIGYLTEQRNRAQQKIGGQKEAIRRAEAGSRRKQQELDRHHAQFQQWEDMADKGAAQIEENRRYGAALQDIATRTHDGDYQARYHQVCDIAMLALFPPESS